METGDMNLDLMSFAPLTLTQFLIRSQPPKSRGAFTLLMMALQTAVKVTEKNIRRAGMKNMFGVIEGVPQNATGDQQAKLDVISNNAFKAYLGSSTCVTILGSEEEEDIILIDKDKCGDYIIFFDPLDGSSNIDANVTIGSIWCIWRLPPGEEINSKEKAKDLLQKLNGNDIVSAGYVMYGSATSLIISIGQGVDGFTLDPRIGEFVLTHPHIRIPKSRRIFSANEGYFRKWDPWFKKYVMHIKDKEKKAYSYRYIGSMVADIHRTLLYGGIFCYPRTTDKPSGKLRFLYEAAPMAYIVEQAGGKALDGQGRILDQKVKSMHQRTPVFLGSPQEVDFCMSFCDKYGGTPMQQSKL
ncbi:unnamed protein product [Phytomonas sp. EM1]|nr:unnamed protein product [Phytomonas sp. EM1]|eukprot:CCW64800.1 unnamed protein product [Phytomonas sp. isolate EM1]